METAINYRRAIRSIEGTLKVVPVQMLAKTGQTREWLESELTRLRAELAIIQDGE